MDGQTDRQTNDNSYYKLDHASMVSKKNVKILKCECTITHSMG